MPNSNPSKNCEVYISIKPTANAHHEPDSSMIQITLFFFKKTLFSFVCLSLVQSFTKKKKMKQSLHCCVNFFLYKMKTVSTNIETKRKYL